MAIAQLTHLHLTIPSSRSISEPVPGECYPVVLLPQESVISRLVSFAQEIAIIESTPLSGSLAEAPDSLTEAATGDLKPPDWGIIQFNQPDYMLFPREEPMDDSDCLSLSLSQIDRVPPGASGECMSSSSSVVSDDSDGTRDCCQHFWALHHSGRRNVLQSHQICLIAVQLTVRPEISSSGVAGFGHGCAFRSTTYRPSDYAQPSGKYGLPLHNPRFLEWIGAPESARLLDKGPSVWLPLTRPANFTKTCAL